MNIIKRIIPRKQVLIEKRVLVVYIFTFYRSYFRDGLWIQKDIYMIRTQEGRTLFTCKESHTKNSGIVHAFIISYCTISSDSLCLCRSHIDQFHCTMCAMATIVIFIMASKVRSAAITPH